MEQLTPREWMHEQLKRVPAFAASAGLMALIIVISMFIELSGAKPVVHLAATEAELMEQEQATLNEIKQATPEMQELKPLPENTEFPEDAPEVDDPNAGTIDAPLTDVDNPTDFTEDPTVDALGPGSDPVPMELTKKMAVIGTEAGTGGFRGSLGNRKAGGRRSAARRYGMPTGTDQAILAALRWLKSRQETQGVLAGGWKCEGSSGESVGVTGLALLAFLGYGCTDREPTEFAPTVKAAIKFLMDKQATFEKNPKTNGFFGERMYTQGIATLALAEAYGMTGRHDVKQAAQAGLDYILRVQPAWGGFGYGGAGGDESVAGFNLQAIKAGIDGGLTVPTVSKMRTEAWLRSTALAPTGYQNAGAWIEQNGELVKKSEPAMTSGGNASSPSRQTAVALTTRLFLGHKRTDKDCIMQADWLMNTDKLYETLTAHDYYYTYYMSLAMFQMGGSYWDKWNKNFNAPLRALQEKNGPDKGSWSTAGDTYGGYGGRVYTTSMACLALEVYWRYQKK